MNATLEKIAEAFAEVEKHDIRVGRMVLDRAVYTELATSNDSTFLNVYSNNPWTLPPSRRESTHRIGMLWGADVEIGGVSKVYGEAGFAPRQSWGSEPVLSRGTINTDFEYSVDIFDDTWCEANKLRLKLGRLRNNMTIIVKSRAAFFGAIPRNEWTAIETLREMITEQEFRKYMKYGFVLVPGQSGATYQVFRNRAHTKVWKNGKVVEEICVRISHDQKCPPTDNVITFMTMIRASEDEFKKTGNVYRNMERAA